MGKHNDTQDLLIRAIIRWLSKQLNTCIILLLDFRNLSLFLYCSLLQKFCCAHINGFLKLGHICYSVQLQKEMKSNPAEEGHSEKRCEIQGGGQEMALMVGKNFNIRMTILGAKY